MPSLIFTALAGIPLIQKGDDLNIMIGLALDRSQITLIDGDVLVVAQKIISKSEGRMVDLETVNPSPGALKLALESDKDPRLAELILQESRQVLRVRRGLIIVEHKLGFVCANAGIDRSNVTSAGNESVLLLPENPDLSASRLRSHFLEIHGVNLGVVIIDSHGRPWRNGTVGISIGFSGLPGVMDLRGEPDLFDYTLQATEIAVVDELAAGASLLMGQAAEGLPVVHARGFPYQFRDGSFSELPRDLKNDLFR